MDESLCDVGVGLQPRCLAHLLEHDLGTGLDVGMPQWFGEIVAAIDEVVSPEDIDGGDVADLDELERQPRVLGQQFGVGLQQAHRATPGKLVLQRLELGLVEVGEVAAGGRQSVIEVLAQVGQVLRAPVGRQVRVAQPVVVGDLLLHPRGEVVAHPVHGHDLALGGQAVQQEAEDLRHRVGAPLEHGVRDGHGLGDQVLLDEELDEGGRLGDVQLLAGLLQDAVGLDALDGVAVGQGLLDALVIHCLEAELFFGLRGRGGG